MADLLTKVIATLEDSKVWLKAEQDKLRELGQDDTLDETDCQEFITTAASDLDDIIDSIDAAITDAREIKGTDN